MGGEEGEGAARTDLRKVFLIDGFSEISYSKYGLKGGGGGDWCSPPHSPLSVPVTGDDQCTVYICLPLWCTHAYLPGASIIHVIRAKKK